MDGKALEAALALWQMPSLRAALRQRPLPDDVGEVIELAAGSPDRLAQAAGRVDVPPDQVLEAVRFYITEVLMYDGADAYRVLGVSRGGEASQIKAHHRALLRWLHPDRHHDAWESVYAKRINIAWGELRTPERCEAYDARNNERSPAGEVVAMPHRVLVTDWRAAPGEQVQWRGWLVVATVVAACIWLAVLANRQASAPPPEWIVASEPGSEPEVAPPTALATVLERAATRARQAKNAETAAKSERSPRPTAARPPKAMIAAPVAKPARAVAPAIPKLIATTRPVPVKAPVKAPVQIKAPAPVPGSAKVAVAAPAPAKPRVESRTRKAIAAVSMPAAPTPAAPPVLAAKAPSVSAMADMAQLERVRLAHRRGDEVTRYLASSSTRVPPIWRSVASQDAAASLRDRLDGGRTRVARMFGPARFGDPAWRISSDRATMVSTIERSGSGAGEGILRVELAWRDGMWLVDTIKAENLP